MHYFYLFVTENKLFSLFTIPWFGIQMYKANTNEPLNLV